MFLTAYSQNYIISCLFSWVFKKLVYNKCLLSVYYIKVPSFFQVSHNFKRDINMSTKH